METDLRVIVGKDGTQQQKEYHYHAALLAAQSNFVDAMLLAAPMKESQEKTIHLPDLDPSTWQAMMKFSPWRQVEA